jgi:predicted RNA polymerase sigma factor
LIDRGLAALDRAHALDRPLGAYGLQAAIAACHACAATPQATDWHAIVTLYDKLVACVPSTVVALNRSVAIGMAYGPEAALPLVEALAAEPAMQRYGLLHAVHGDLLDRLGLAAEACKAFERAAALASNEQDEALMRRRADRLRA